MEKSLIAQQNSTNSLYKLSTISLGLSSYEHIPET